MENLGEFILNHWVLSSAFVVLSWLVLSESLNSKLSGFNAIGTAQAILLVNKQKGVFVDIRSESEFENGHIAESVNMPFTQIDEQVSVKFKDKSQPIVLVCDSGQKAKTAAKQMNKAGFTDVHVLSGGLNTWKDAKLPLFN
jgi:rhodanese-related sulfurtransferase